MDALAYADQGCFAACSVQNTQKQMWTFSPTAAKRPQKNVKEGDEMPNVVEILPQIIASKEKNSP